MSDPTEFDIIYEYFVNPAMNAGPHVVLGPGDDCAILQVPADTELCVSTDTLLAGVHFPVDATGDVAAHRTVAANLSDLAAMGAEPHSFTLASTFDSADPVWLRSFAGTIAALCERFRVPLVGGNLSRGPLSLTIQVMGLVPTGAALRRDGAAVGDDVYVSGTLGDGAAGLRVHLRGGASPLVERYLHPEPRLDLGVALRGLASSAVDISDGLLADLGHVCKASGVGAAIELASVPMDESLPDALAGSDTDPVALALTGGDDYELAFTALPRHADKIQAVAQRLAIRLTRIGQVEAGPDGVRCLDANGRVVKIPETGYRHF
jgi:thiamine-monophosphate kinase